MTLRSKMQIALLAAGSMLVIWQLRESALRRSELASVQAELENQQRELDAKQAALDELTAKNQQQSGTESQADNETLLAVMRERAAAARAAADSPSQNSQRPDSSKHEEAEQEYQRNKVRADLDTFFRLLKLPPEKAEEYVSLSVDFEQRKAARVSALASDKLAVADAIRERDNDERELEKRRHEVLGDSGYEFLQGIADGMRNDESKRLVKLIQQNMGNNSLSQDQSDRLQNLIKSEIVTIHADDVEVFRQPDDLSQEYVQRLENVLGACTGYLTPAQIETLRTIAAYDLADRQKRVAARRQTLRVNSQ